MSLRRLAVLAAVLAVAALYYYIVEVRVAETRHAREAEAKQLFHFAADDAGFLEWRRPEDTIRLAKRDGLWHVTEPVRERADESAVSGVLSLLATLTPARALEDPDALAEYGLADPGLTVQVQDAEGYTLAVLDVGDASPDGTRRFVHTRDGDTIGLITTANHDTIAKTLFDLRSKQWTTVTLAAVTAVRLQQPDTALDAQLVKEGLDTWSLAGDSPKPAKRSVVRALLSRLLNARIMEVVAETADDLAPYGLEAPAYTITVTGAHEETTLHVGAEAPDSTPTRRYASLAGDPRVLAFNSSVFDTYPDAATELRDPTLLRFSRSDVQRIALHYGDSTAAVLRDPTGDGSWLMEGPEAWRADEVEVGALLGRIERLEATGFLGVDDEPMQPADFDAAPLTVELGFPAGTDPLRVRFAQGAASDTWYALCSGDAEVYPVADDAVAALQLRRDVLRDKHLLHFDADAVHRIEAQVGARHLVYTRHGERTWRPGPGAATLAPEDLEQLLLDLAELAFIRELPDAAPALEGDPALAITLRDLTGAELARVRIGALLKSADSAIERAAATATLTVAIDGRIVDDWARRLGG